MDISVSQLNHRLALQLPAELPLGLVFVSGTAVQISREKVKPDNGHSTTLASFDLVQNGHRLRCRLSEREAARVTIAEGDRLRVGGHLVFDPHRAEYYLFARDAEVIDDRAETAEGLKLDPRSLVQDEALTTALAGIKRRAAATKQAPVGLPDWVQKIAPPEVQTLESEAGETAVPMPASATYASSRDQLLLDGALVEFLSEMMESEEEIELTPEMLSPYTSVPQPAGKADAVLPGTAAAPDDLPGEDEAAPAPVQPYALVTETVSTVPPAVGRPPAPIYHQTDWLVVVLITTSVIFTLALIVTIIILAVQ